MKIESIKNTKTNFKGGLNSKLLLNGLEFTAKNGALVSAATMFGLSTVCRPLSILAAPKADKKDKQYACAKSLASSAVGLGLAAAITTPVAKAVEKIDKNPEKFLNSDTLKNLSNGAKNVTKSGAYKFSTQLFKLGSGILTSYPKAALTTMFVPAFMTAVFNKTKKSQNSENVLKNSNNANLSFKGVNSNFGRNFIEGKFNGLSSFRDKFSDKLAEKFAGVINKPSVQEFAKKHSDSNFAQHIFCATDAITTGFTLREISKSKRINNENKKELMLNSGIACGLSIGASYLADKLTEKPTQKFIEKFKEANKNSPKLDRYVEGIKIAKPIAVLGGLYYIAIPFVSTILADKFNSDEAKSKKIEI